MAVQMYCKCIIIFVFFTPSSHSHSYLFLWVWLELLVSINIYVSVCLQGYDNTESSVRKASVFCLVAIYSVIGEELKPHLAQLTGSKVQSFAHQFNVLCPSSHLSILLCLFASTSVAVCSHLP